MRVALIVERFEPAAGGVEHAVWTLAHHLAEAGDRVRVLARRAAHSPAVTISLLPVPTFWQPLRVACFTARVQSALRAATDEFEVVHTFCRVPGGDCFHAGGGSHAHYMRRTYGALGSALRRVSPRHGLQLALERRLFADPQLRVQCVSSMVARELSERFGLDPGRMRLVPYGVDIARFRPSAPADAGDVGERSSLRAELAVGQDAPVWLLAGSGWRRKGLDTALRALSRTRDPESVLWVAGKDAPSAWQRMARRFGVAHRVRFVGLRDDLERVMRASDGLLLPTRYDAFGMVCLEAAASGLPVITSGAAGAAELLGDAARTVADPEDSAAFASELDALGDAALRRSIGERGRAVAEANTWDHQTRRLRDLYAEIASEAPRP